MEGGAVSIYDTDQGRFLTLPDPFFDELLGVQREYCPALLTFCRSVLKEGDIVLDIGANIGAVTVPLAGMVGKSGHVIAVEPQPLVSRVLNANLAINGRWNATVMNAAMGDRMGTVTVPILDPEKPNNYGGLGLDDFRGGAAVPMVTVDSLALRRLDLMKIDVEGHEMTVLEGAGDTLARCRPVVIAEAEIGTLADDLVAWAPGHGYRPHWLTTQYTTRATEGIWRDCVSIDMVLWPEESGAIDLPRAVTSDWRGEVMAWQAAA